MADKKIILALDQGTTGSAALAFDPDGKVLAHADREFAQHFPRPGWVEHDADEIWSTTYSVAAEAIAKAGVRPEDVAAIGITNQRETAVVWDARTGKPLSRAIVWQDRRTAPRCEELREDGWEATVRRKTGLVIDAYFSATKVQWMIENVPAVKRAVRDGRARFGTIDSWLIHKLTGGAAHVTDASNASRTLLFNIDKLDWDRELLQEFKVPEEMLPEVGPSSGGLVETDPSVFGARVPIAGVAGDQQAALFGQACLKPGQAKNTYGTGSFLLMNSGAKRPKSKRLLATVAWDVGGKAEYALEGSVFTTGASVQWLRDQLGLVATAAETEGLALSVPDTGGVAFVPALQGLGAPWWDMYARGALLGVTRGPRTGSSNTTRRAASAASARSACPASRSPRRRA